MAQEIQLQKASKDEKLDKHTLFIRKIALETTNQEFEEFFSLYGPIRSCFVVSAKNDSAAEKSTEDASSTKNKGIGFVNFVTEEDAAKALSELASRKFKGRKLKGEYAMKKHLVKKMSAEDSSEKKDRVKDLIANILQAPNEKNKAPLPKKKDHRAALIKADVLVYGIGKDVEKKQLYKKVRKFGNVMNIEFPYAAFGILNDETSSAALLTYASIQDAEQAISKLNEHIFKAKKLSAVPFWSLKQHRLIVRNLSFKATEASLIKAFSPYGKVLECTLPKKPDGQMRGFAFVQLCSKENAAKLMEEMNSKSIEGRPVAIDWCLSKDAFEKSNASEETANISEAHSEADSVAAEDLEEDEIEESDFVSAESEEGEDEVEESNDEEDEEDGEEISQEEESVSEASEDELNNSLENEEEEKPPKSIYECDSSKTVFVRNISYDTTEENIKECFSQFGNVKYVKIVIDKATGVSKGCAFVNFREESTLEACLEKAAESEFDGKSMVVDESKGIVLDGRVLFVFKAVDRSSATELTAKGKKEAEKRQNRDKRNLNLLKEGYVSRSSPNAHLFSEQELTIRENSFKERQRKLKNINYFVSPTRLSLRNLPLTLDEKQLRQTIKNFGFKLSSVKQVKIVRSKERKDQSGDFRSMGYGFVEFYESENSLKFLRLMNDFETNSFSNIKRKAIVEFSIENGNLLKKRTDRIVQAKRRLLEKDQADADEKSKTSASKRFKKSPPKSKKAPKKK